MAPHRHVQIHNNGHVDTAGCTTAVSFGAWAESFRNIGLWTLLLLAVMATLTYVVEFVASTW
ncbi:MAG: hypothetical protein PHY09_07775 [Desulfuromonadaceae bacterium]|nr:hypothetical protein [Desulfuromonadaceae bacterium]